MDGSVKRTSGGSGGERLCRRGAQAGFAAVLTMRALPRFTPAELLTALNRILAKAGSSAELDPGLTRFEENAGTDRVWRRPQVPPRVGVVVAGVTLVIEGHDRPPFGVDEAGALEFRSWPAGARDIARARAHVRIFEAEPAIGADLDANHDRAAAVTAVAAAAAELAAPAGIVWEASGVAVPAGELVAALPALMAGEPPVALWIGTGAEPWGGVATRGLYPLLGGEVEVRPAGLSQEMAGRVAMGVAAEILETGVPPAEGAQIAHGPRAVFYVRYRGAEDGGAPAIVLDQAPPGATDLAAGAA